MLQKIQLDYILTKAIDILSKNDKIRVSVVNFKRNRRKKEGKCQVI